MKTWIFPVQEVSSVFVNYFFLCIVYYCWNWVFCCVFLVNVSQGELLTFGEPPVSVFWVLRIQVPMYHTWVTIDLLLGKCCTSMLLGFCLLFSNPIYLHVSVHKLSYQLYCQDHQLSASVYPPSFLSLVFNNALLFPDCILIYLFYIYIVFCFIFVNLLVLICIWLVK